MLGVLVSLLFAGAGLLAIGAIGATVTAQAGAVRGLLRQSRAGVAHREYCVSIVSDMPAVAPAAGCGPRRAAVRSIRRTAERRIAPARRAAA
ncbi:hypothetical protein [Novosphingobium sp. MD-1]|uniref:hypothetical protein n=1 Tax=Novosphingobium sp. MD-1 TaxID=1630648 RepID=UPI000F7DD77B|nr:hypothetical protein [Novosphingobium sp. MD-1]